MKFRKFRIRKVRSVAYTELSAQLFAPQVMEDAYAVQMRQWYGWVTVRAFAEMDDSEFARIRAEELFEKLTEI